MSERAPEPRREGPLVALVTGASAGIGLAIAGKLARDGHAVALAARRPEPLAAAADTLLAQGAAKVMPIACDTTDQHQVDALAETVLDACGRIDVLVNSAANPSGVAGEIEHVDPEALLRDLDTKVVGYVRCIKAVAAAMKRQRFGRIVNIGGLTGRSSNTLSGMRNVAVSHLTKTLSDELGPFGVTVNAVHPGLVRTSHLQELFASEAQREGREPAEVEADFVAQVPLRRLIEPAGIADAVAFLISPAAASITGESLTVDGGYSRGIYL